MRFLQNIHHTVELVYSFALIAVVGAHVFEEAAKDFRSFLNLRWFRGNEECPVTRRKALLVDQIGLLAALALLAVAGAWEHASALFILIAVGFVAADAVQHTVFTVGCRGYTPGAVTTLFYVAYVVVFCWLELGKLWKPFGGAVVLAALALGAAPLLANYWMARSKARRGC